MPLSASALAFVTCITVVGASNCDVMKEAYSNSPDQYVTQHGSPKTIILYWDSDLTRAAAAFLSVSLRYGLGYQLVQLQQTPHNVSTTEASSDDEKLLEKLELTLFVDMMVRDEHKCDAKNVTPTKLKLHVHIANHLRHKKQCIHMTELGYYNDITRLKDCGFRNSTTSKRQTVEVYYLHPDYNMTAVETSLNTSSIQLQYKELSRKNLFHMLREGDESFLFLDYDMWDEDEDVSVVKLHPCLKTDTIIANRIANENLVKELAREIFDATNSFTPSLKSLKEILELESRGKSIEDAACKWADRDGYNTVETTLKSSTPSKICIFICLKDKELKNDTNLDYMITIVGNLIKRQYFNIKLHTYFINCTHADSIVEDLEDFIVKHVKPTTNHIGYVIGRVKNIEDDNVVKVLNKINLPVLIHDAINIDFNSMNSVWMTNGRLLHLALALKHFIASKATTHVMMLTESTLKAKKFYADLTEISGLILINYEVHHHLTLEEAEDVLKVIKNKISSVILVNTNNDNAATILTAAVRLNMNDNKITWILREWSERDVKTKLNFLTFSFWYENGRDALTNNNGQDLEVLWTKQKWPSKAMATADAVLTLVMGMKDVFNKYPEVSDDIQRTQIIHTQFEKSLRELSPLRTAYQNLTYKGHWPEEVLVYMNEWYNGQRTLLARYRVNATAQSVQLDWERVQSDVVKGGNAFRQRCNVLMIATIIFLLNVYGNF